jgi:hypothetical protein
VWVDYAIYLTTGLVLLAGITLIVVVVRDRAHPWAVITLVALILVGVVATVFVRPERFREPGEDLQIVEVDGAYQTEVALVGQCLSLFRRLGPLSYITGNDLFPGDNWNRVPFDSCEAVGFMDAVIYLPASVASGDWMLCDHSLCHGLEPSASS